MIMTMIMIMTIIVIPITAPPNNHHFHKHHYQHHHAHRQAIDASPWPSALELLKTAGWLKNLRGLSRAAQLQPGWRSSVALLGASTLESSTTLPLVFRCFSCILFSILLPSHRTVVICNIL